MGCKNIKWGVSYFERVMNCAKINSIAISSLKYVILWGVKILNGVYSLMELFKNASKTSLDIVLGDSFICFKRA